MIDETSIGEEAAAFVSPQNEGETKPLISDIEAQNEASTLIEQFKNTRPDADGNLVGMTNPDVVLTRLNQKGIEFNQLTDQQQQQIEASAAYYLAQRPDEMVRFLTNSETKKYLPVEALQKIQSTSLVDMVLNHNNGDDRAAWKEAATNFQMGMARMGILEIGARSVAAIEVVKEICDGAVSDRRNAGKDKRTVYDLSDVIVTLVAQGDVETLDQLETQVKTMLTGLEAKIASVDTFLKKNLEIDLNAAIRVLPIIEARKKQPENKS